MKSNKNQRKVFSFPSSIFRSTTKKKEVAQQSKLLKNSSLDKADAITPSFARKIYGWLLDSNNDKSIQRNICGQVLKDSLEELFDYFAVNADIKKDFQSQYANLTNKPKKQLKLIDAFLNKVTEEHGIKTELSKKYTYNSEKSLLMNIKMKLDSIDKFLESKHGFADCDCDFNFDAEYDHFALRQQEIIKTVRNISYKCKAFKYYNLPASKPAEVTLSKDTNIENQYSFPVHKFSEPLDTKSIYSQSENFCISHEEGPFNKNNLYQLIKEQFPFEEVDGQIKLLPRKHGLKNNLRMFFNNLKNYEPALYNYCLSAAKTLSKPGLENPPEAFTCITAHQSEEGLPHMMSLIKEQSLTQKDNSPVFLFINGNDQNLIDKRLLELEEFKKENPELDLRVVTAQLPEWRYGAKSISLVTSLMSLQLAGAISDKELTCLLFDGDLLGYENNQVMEVKNKVIQDGSVIECSGVKEDQGAMKSRNINFYLLDRINSLNLFPNFSMLKTLGMKIKHEPQKLFFQAPGGNMSLSTILLTMFGGFSSYLKLWEDHDLSEKCSANLLNALSLDSLQGNNHSQYTRGHAVICDGGAIDRTVLLRRLLCKDKFETHDGKEGNCTAVDTSQPNLICTKRIQEEIEGMIQKGLDGLHRDCKRFNNAPWLEGLTGNIKEHSVKFEKDLIEILQGISKDYEWDYNWKSSNYKIEDTKIEVIDNGKDKPCDIKLIWQGKEKIISAKEQL